MRNMAEFSEKYRTDGKFRSQVEADPVGALIKNFDLPNELREAFAGRKVRWVCDTPKAMHFVMPDAPLSTLQDGELKSVSGGAGLASANSVAVAFGSGGFMPSAYTMPVTAVMEAVTWPRAVKPLQPKPPQD